MNKKISLCILLFARTFVATASSATATEAEQQKEEDLHRKMDASPSYPKDICEIEFNPFSPEESVKFTREGITEKFTFKHVLLRERNGRMSKLNAVLACATGRLKPSPERDNHYVKLRALFFGESNNLDTINFTEAQILSLPLFSKNNPYLVLHHSFPDGGR